MDLAMLDMEDMPLQLFMLLPLSTMLLLFSLLKLAMEDMDLAMQAMEDMPLQMFILVSLFTVLLVLMLLHLFTMDMAALLTHRCPPLPPFLLLEQPLLLSLE